MYNGILTNDIKNKNYWKKDFDTGSTLSYRNGFFILELKGTPYERGFAHGKLLREQIESSNICEYYGGFLKNLFDSSDVIMKIPRRARKPIKNLLEWIYYSPLEKICLEETRDEMYGLCDAVNWQGEKKKQALRATFAPDIMEHLAAAFLKGVREIGSYYLGGCSGAYARGKAVRDKSYAYFARNMDFPGVFQWVHPTIIFAYPSERLTILEKGKMKETEEVKKPYLHITTAGFPGNGLTGMNSSGTAMATFVCLSKKCSKKGLSKLDFNHYLFTRGKTINQITEILDNPNLKCISPHTVVFADSKQAISVEVDSKNKRIRYSSEEDIHIQTNHFLTRPLKNKELKFPLATEFSLCRYLLIDAALGHKKNYGNLDLQKMVDIISCNLNLNERKTGLVGDFPAQPNTLTSVVFKLYGKTGFDSSNPKKNELWVASGKPPAVCYNPYYKLGFNENFSWDRKSWGAVTRSSRPVIEGTNFTPIKKETKESLISLMHSQEELKHGRLDHAIENIKEARNLYDDPGYRYLEAILHMKNGDINDAFVQFTYLKENHSFGPVKDSALRLWIARCLDVLGKREDAVSYYKKIMKKPNLSEHFKKAARHSIKRPFSLSEMPKSIDYFLLGPLEFC